MSPYSKRSSAPDPACEANTEDTVRYELCAFFSHIPYSQVCAHEVHGWALESGKAGGIRAANSSWYGGCSAHLVRASSIFVLPPGNAPIRSACVELEVNVSSQRQA